MRNLGILVIAMLVTIYLFTSSDSETNDATEEDAAGSPGNLGSPETFVWHGQQPVSFSPPSGWQAGRYQQGGRDGADFIDSGQRIAVTEYIKVGELDGCANLQNILSELDSADRRTLQRKLQVAVRSPRSVDANKQVKMLRSVRESVDKALAALSQNDLSGVRRQIDNGLRTRFKYRLDLDDYLDEVMYDRTASGDLKRVEIDYPEQLTVGGEPAVSVDYEVDIEAQYVTGKVKKSEVGREVYVMNNNRLFIASFQGKRENMVLFEKVIASITFPDGLCSL